jgi:hypothetical protein
MCECVRGISVCVCVREREREREKCIIEYPDSVDRALIIYNHIIRHFVLILFHLSFHDFNTSYHVECK